MLVPRRRRVQVVALFVAAAVATTTAVAFTWSFAVRRSSSPRGSSVALQRSSSEASEVDVDSSSSRRAYLQSVASATGFFLWTPTLSPSPAEASVWEGPVDTFQSLTFNYRGGDFGGLQDLSGIDEPTVDYADFLNALSAGNVTLVEFLAPHGDVAYATFASGKRIRIGKGYPIERNDGWSSPSFAIRSVSNRGVPYKFIVPGLSSYQEQYSSQKQQE